MLHHRYRRTICLLALLVLAGVLPPALHARPAAPPWTHAVVRQEPAPALQGGAPEYTLSIDVDTANRRLTGHMVLVFTNRTGIVLPDAVLRLYPNFPPDVFGGGGDVRMDLGKVLANGQPATPVYEAQRTAARIRLPAPAQPGAAVRLEVDWTASIVPWQRSDGSFPLPSYYPMLAAWTGEWREDVTRFADHVFAAAAVYRASISVPAGLTVIASGATTGSRQVGGKTVFDIVTGTVREFAFTVGRFAVARASHDGIAVNAYYKAGDGMEGAATTVALHAAASLAVYNDRFGAYPYRELDFHLINARRGFDIGVEYPGLIFLLVNGRYTTDTRFVTAHEVAHQWWYGVVGNDIFHEPWIDEAFAQWSPLLVEEHWAGKAAAERVYQDQIVRLASRTNLPCGLGVVTYGSWNTYYAAVYGKGAQFLYTLRRELGDEAFFAGLRRFYADNKYAIGTHADVKAAMERSSGRDLGALFKQWTGK